ncbi:VOC family protein [Solicola sp. PLA-1-18]|uniref:VOC family protein n=1 Tax=Solicola sp. PLA-1-18 TaxID=3380532 RepID=UPI003B79BFA7
MQTLETFSGFAVDDVAAARTFYSSTLGMTVSEQNGMLGLDVGDGHHVLVYPKPHHVPAEFTVLNFRVADVEAAVDELVAAGVEPIRYDGMQQDERGVFRLGGPFIAWFRDPAGNVLSVLQDR